MKAWPPTRYRTHGHRQQASLCGGATGQLLALSVRASPTSALS